MDINVIKKNIRDFLAGSFRIQLIADDTNIFDLGTINSLFFIQLLVFMEKKFGIELGEGEFDVNKLTNINAISELILKKLPVVAESE